MTETPHFAQTRMLSALPHDETGRSGALEGDSYGGRAKAAQSMLVFGLLILLSNCSSSLASYLPNEGRYSVQWDNESERRVVVIGTDSRRRLLHSNVAACRDYVLVWEANDRGIVELESDVVLLKAPLRIGDTWPVATGKGGECHVERKIANMGVRWVEVEEYGVCGGIPVRERTRSRWVVGEGVVQENFGDGRSRTVTRIDHDE